jgi:hypothetical protein
MVSRGRPRTRRQDDLRHIDLAVDTLDFVDSRSIVFSNRENIKGMQRQLEMWRTAEDRRQGSSPKMCRSTQILNNIGDAPPWRGLPFGVV